MSEESAPRPPVSPAPKRRRKPRPKTARISWRKFDPAATVTGGDDTLLAEHLTYKKNLDLLLERKGEYVLIKGDAIIGYYPDLESALDAGAERFGREPALSKKIVEFEPLYSFGGLLD